MDRDGGSAIAKKYNKCWQNKSRRDYLYSIKVKEELCEPVMKYERQTQIFPSYYDCRYVKQSNHARE